MQSTIVPEMHMCRQQKITLYGQIFPKNGIYPQPKNVEAIQKCSPLKDKKSKAAKRRFQGMKINTVICSKENHMNNFQLLPVKNN